MESPEFGILQILVHSLVNASEDEHASACLLTDNLILASHHRNLPFAAAISGLGFKVALKAWTRAVEDILHAYPWDNKVDENDLYVPIVQSFEDLEYAFPYDAALVRKEEVLVTWSDKSSTIMNDYCNMEHQLRHFTRSCLCNCPTETPLLGIQPHDKQSPGLPIPDHDQSSTMQRREISEYSGYQGFFDGAFQARLHHNLAVVGNRTDTIHESLRDNPRPIKTSRMYTADPLTVPPLFGDLLFAPTRLSTTRRTILQLIYQMPSFARSCENGSSDDNDKKYVDTETPRKHEWAHTTSTGTFLAPHSRTRRPQSGSREQKQRHRYTDSAATAEEKRKGRAVSCANTLEPVPSAETGCGRAQSGRAAKRKRLDSSIGGINDGYADTDSNADSDANANKRKKKKREPHEGKRRFACPRPGCEWSFDTRYDFRRHLLQCFKISKHVCSSCEMCFPRVDALKCHRKGENACEDHLKRCAKQAEAGEQLGDGSSASSSRVGDLSLSKEVLDFLREFLHEDEMDGMPYRRMSTCSMAAIAARTSERAEADFGIFSGNEPVRVAMNFFNHHEDLTDTTSVVLRETNKKRFEYFQRVRQGAGNKGRHEKTASGEVYGTSDIAYSRLEGDFEKFPVSQSIRINNRRSQLFTVVKGRREAVHTPSAL
ncbi:predicted protein [Postia placenta Mad-698-R]|nr:predicted protein [Postia placenta Mad-698-R]